MTARTVTVKLRTSDFRIVTRSRTLPSDVSDAAGLRAIAAVLAFEVERPAGAVRLLGVAVSSLRPRAQQVIQPGLRFPSSET